MAANEYVKFLPRVLVYEGGKVDDPDDPGGRTAYGVTQGTYNAYRRRHNVPVRDVFDITQLEVADIYKTMYWDRVQGDKLPMGLGMVVGDAAVNSGVGQAGKWLQQALGGHFTGTVDGIIGDKTLQAIADMSDEQMLIHEYCARRLGTLKRLKHWNKYGRGWTARIANVQKIGLAWNAESPAPNPVKVTTLDGHRKAPVADNMSQPCVSQVAAHVTAASSTVAAGVPGIVNQLTPLGDTFKWVPWVCGSLTLLAVVAGFLAKASADASALAEKGLARAEVDENADDEGLPVVMAA